jgi:hypothetical protein
VASQQGDANDGYLDRGIPATVWGWSIAAMLAAAGVIWYVLAPGVVSTFASFVLVAPLGAAVLLLLYHHLPVGLQWTLALVLALVGPVGYLVQGGDAWWNFGQWAVWPLVLLIIARAQEGGGASGMDGPWGPP